jgi:hypothetical protein
VSDIAALRSRCAQLEAQLAEAEAANLLLRGVALDGVEAVRAALATTPAATTAVGLDPATIEACASACEDASGMGDMYARRIRALLAKEGT